MKKLISLALAGGMVLSLAACGSSASTAASTATESTVHCGDAPPRALPPRASS